MSGAPPAWGPAAGDPAPDGPPPRPSTRAKQRSGPRVTPTRVMLVVAVVGSVAFVGYAFSVRDTQQLPLLAAGLAVLGLVFAALAVIGVWSTYRAGAEGRTGRALMLALLGGLASIIALGCFAAALIGAMAYRNP